MKLISNSGTERALDELKSWPTEGSTIDVMSPSFSVHAFDAVADQLERAGKCRMILIGTWSILEWSTGVV